MRAPQTHIGRNRKRIATRAAVIRRGPFAFTGKTPPFAAFCLQNLAYSYSSLPDSYILRPKALKYPLLKSSCIGCDRVQKALAQPHTKQFLKFAVVGLISFGIDWGLLIALVEGLHMDFLTSSTVSFITSVVVNYVLSMKYVFDHREGMSRKREFTVFTILSIIGLGLNDLYMFVGVTFLSIGYQAMKAIATFLVTWYNYFSRRLFLEGARS